MEKNGTLIEKLVNPGSTLRNATFESLFDIIKEVHEEGLKHGCRDILNKKLQTMYANISVKQIQAFVDCCEVCQVKKGRMKKGVVVKPIVTSGMNRRCQVDCIDMQSNHGLPGISCILYFFPKFTFNHFSGQCHQICLFGCSLVFKTFPMV